MVRTVNKKLVECRQGAQVGKKIILLILLLIENLVISELLGLWIDI